MKKLLLSLAAVIFSITAASADEVTIDFSTAEGLPTADTGTADATIDGIPFSFSHCKSGKYSGATYLQISGKTYYTAENPAYLEFTLGGTVSSVTVTTGTNASKSAKMDLDVNGVAAVEGLALNNTAAEFTFTIPADKQVAGATIRLVSTANVKYNAQITKMVVTYTGGGQVVVKDPAGMSFPEASYTVKLDEEFPTPSLNKDTDANPVYSSSVETVATVDAATGAVTLVGVGTTVITATCEETDDFKAGSASYTLVVEDPNTFWAPNCKATDSEFTFEATGETNPWSVDTRYGLKASGFISSAAVATDAVAASPVLDFTEYTPVALNYRQALNQFKVNNANIESTDENLAAYVSVVAKEEGATEWTKIGTVNAPASFGWNFYDATPVDLSAYAGKKVQIGFRYVSTTECAGTWEVDNVVVTAKKAGNAVESIAVDNTNAPVEYYNLQGVRVANPATGNIYIVRQGTKVSKQLVK